MMPQAKAKKQSFEISVYDICNEEVLGDRLRINQILINIISNALKYTPVGGNVEMTVRQLEQRTKNYAHFRFVISDNGIGMSKEYMENIFRPFSRESTAKTAEIQGTGLGMAITKNLVDLMGGTIEVKSEPDKGSIFTLDVQCSETVLCKLRDYRDPGVAGVLCLVKAYFPGDGVFFCISDSGVDFQGAYGADEMSDYHVSDTGHFPFDTGSQRVLYGL